MFRQFKRALGHCEYGSTVLLKVHKDRQSVRSFIYPNYLYMGPKVVHRQNKFVQNESIHFQWRDIVIVFILQNVLNHLNLEFRHSDNHGPHAKE